MIANGSAKKKSRVFPVNVLLSQENRPPVIDDHGRTESVPLQPRKSDTRPRGVSDLSILTIGRAKVGISRWRKAANEEAKEHIGQQRQRGRQKLGISNINKVNFHQMNAAQLSDLEDLVEDCIDGVHKGTKNDAKSENGNSVNSSSRALLCYFAKLAAKSDEHEIIDLEFVDTLLKVGANINITDRHGQTVMHEAARQWEVEVAKFLMEKGANINQVDKYGRSPLHVAAAVDYPEMVEFLVTSGADITACTEGELQTPIHFAARNDAANSLKMLIKCGSGIEYRDYKHRTPLQVAAELDRSDTAKLLIEMGADAGVEDDSGLTAFVMMISKMPSVAKQALDQFYSRDRANRKQFFHLNYLEPTIPKCLSSGWPQTAMEVVILHKQFDLIMHPVFLRLIQIKWENFGKRGAWLQVILGIVFVVLWTVFGVATATQGAHDYSPLHKKWWKIVIVVIASLLTLNEIRSEISEYYFSKKEHLRWKKWRENELNKDLAHCHPRWPGERMYLMQEIEALRRQEPTYFKDAWNIFDWISYFLICASVIAHLISALTTYRAANKVHTRIMSATVIILWIRLLKVCRPFTAIGPFVVMGGHIIFDVLKFGLLYIILYIPYAASFWMVFASHKVSGYTEIPDLLYSMFRMTVVDEYNYDKLSEVEPIMAKVMCGTYIALSAIVCLNLFIALMSDTFQRVYDNVKANSVMQKASTIMSLENGLSVAKKRRFASFIHSRCAPDELYYDDDIVDDEEHDLKRMTFQIKDSLDEVHELLKTEDKTKRGSGKPQDSSFDIETLRKQMTKIELQQQLLSDRVNSQFDEIKEALSVIIQRLNRRKKHPHQDDMDGAPTNKGDLQQ